MKANEHNPYLPNLNKKYYRYYSKATDNAKNCFIKIRKKTTVGT